MTVLVFLKIFLAWIQGLVKEKNVVQPEFWERILIFQCCQKGHQMASNKGFRKFRKFRQNFMMEII